MSSGEVESHARFSGDASRVLSTQCHQLQVGEDNLSLAITPFANRVLVIVSAYGKIGHLLDISKESAPYEAALASEAAGDGEDAVISVNRLLGAEDEDVEVAGRYIAESIMAKSNGTINSILLGVSLRHYDRASVKEATEKILALL